MERRTVGNRCCSPQGLANNGGPVEPTSLQRWRRKWQGPGWQPKQTYLKTVPFSTIRTYFKSHFGWFCCDGINTMISFNELTLSPKFRLFLYWSKWAANCTRNETILLIPTLLMVYSGNRISLFFLAHTSDVLLSLSIGPVLIDLVTGYQVKWIKNYVRTLYTRSSRWWDILLKVYSKTGINWLKQPMLKCTVKETS